MAVKTLSKFDQFWECYPRKIAKKRAKAAWDKGKCDAIAEEIIAAVQKQHRYTWKGKEQKYIPHPASWLNGGQWEDGVDIGTWKTDKKSSEPTQREKLPPDCPHDTLLNRVLLAILRHKGGVTIETLRELVKHKKHVVRQWREIWPEEIDYEERSPMLKSVSQRLWEMAGGTGDHPVRFRGG